MNDIKITDKNKMNKNLIAISGRIGSGKDLTAKIINWLIWKEKFHKDDGSIVFQESWYPKESDGGMYKVKKFAYKIKQICSILTGISVEDFEKQEIKDSFLKEEWDYVFQHDSDGFLTQKIQVRTLLQKVGTEAMRNIIHENVWINALFSDYKPSITLENFIANKLKVTSLNEAYFYSIKDSYLSNYNQECTPRWIISDLRFPNELKAIKDREGITIRINRNFVYTGSDLEMNRNNMLKKLEHPSETSLDNAEFDYIIDNSGAIEELIEKVKQILIKEEII